MRYATIKKNDIVDTLDGICVSFWAQGCPWHCPECHNPGTWDFNSGEEKDVNSIIEEIDGAIKAYGIHRDFSLLGGEPLCKENRTDVLVITKEIVKRNPGIKIYCWTGFLLENLLKENDPVINELLSLIDVLIDGPYILAKRDITLRLCGSTNQRTIDLKTTLKTGNITELEIH